jgi:hypothetical protein
LLTNGEDRPLRFLLTGAEVADCRPALRTIELANDAGNVSAILT